MDDVIRPWVMVVDDDSELRDKILLPALTEAGFSVVTVGSALAMYRAMLTRNFDFFVIDVGLPDEDGFSIVRHLRGVTTAGLVLLTGRARTVDKVRGLELGADAYLTKPLDAAVLVASLRSIGRRIDAEDLLASPPARLCSADGWTFDLSGWRLLAPNDAAVKLSVVERELLTILLDARGEVVPRKKIVTGLTDKVSGFEDERLEMLVFRLRRKAGLASGGVELPLHTVRGVGYVLAI